MTIPPSRRGWWQRLLGVKSDREIVYSVLKEPAIHNARRAIRNGERVLRELEAIEGRKR